MKPITTVLRPNFHPVTPLRHPAAWERRFPCGIGAAAICAVILGGCGPINSPRRNTMKDLDMKLSQIGPDAGSPYKNLTVGIFLSDNTKTGFKFLKDHSDNDERVLEKHTVDFLVTPLTGYVELLRRNFKSVQMLEQVEDAETRKADVIAIVDFYPTWRGLRFSEAKFDSSIILWTSEKREIDKLRAVSQGKPGAGCPIIPTICMARNVKILIEDNQHQLEKLLLSSYKLRDLNESLGTPSSEPSLQAKNPPPPASPPRSHHSDVDLPVYSENEAHPDDYAMVIGVEKYDTLPPADFAERDAQAVREHLISMGYPSGNIIYLTGRNASRTNIVKNLESWLPRNVNEKSRVFFYFSGHGAPDTQTRMAYLVPWDGDPSSLEQTAYPVKQLYERLNALKAKEVIVAMDACFSGAGGRSVLPKGARPLVNKVDTGSGFLMKSHVVAFAAAGDNEITGTNEMEGHGLFTYYLLKGLNEITGRVTAKRLFDYLEPKVQAAAKRDNRDQTPRLIIATDDQANLRIR